MKTQRSADLYSGLFLSALGVVVLIAASQITSAIAERLPPATLPYVLGVATLISGGLLALRAHRTQQEGAAVAWPDRDGFFRVGITFGGLILYTALIEFLGMPIATALFLAGLVWFLDGRPLRAAVVGLVTAALIYYGFIQLLELTFPLGLLQ